MVKDHIYAYADDRRQIVTAVKAASPFEARLKLEDRLGRDFDERAKIMRTSNATEMEKFVREVIGTLRRDGDINEA